MLAEIHYEHTSRLAKRAWLHYYMHKDAGWLIGMLVITVIGLADLFMGSGSWFGGFCLGAASVYLISWWNSYQAASTYRPKDSRIKVIITNEDLSFELNSRKTTAPWQDVTDLWKFRDLWLFFIRGSEFYSTVPVAAMNAETMAFIENKMKETGGRIE
jgi:hypothetical protein